MDDELDDLIHLADPPGTSGHVVALRVPKRPDPGGEFLDCDFVVSTETVTGTFPVGISSFDLDRPISPPGNWIEDHRARLAKARQILPT